MLPTSEESHQYQWKKAQPNDDPKQKPFCNVIYIFIFDTAGQVCCTMALTELSLSEKEKSYLQAATGYACTIRTRQQNGMNVNQCSPAHGNYYGPNICPANSK